MSSHYAVYDLQREEYRDDFYGENKEDVQRMFREYWEEVRYEDDEKDKLETGLSEEEYYAMEDIMTDEDYLTQYGFVVKELSQKKRKPIDNQVEIDTDKQNEK